MILEGLVTTVDAYGEVNISPMGPRVDASMSRLVLRPYQTAKTYQNLKRVGEGVFHVTDDVLLLAQAAVGEPDPPPLLSRAEVVDGWIIDDACRWYEFRVTSLDDSAERTEIVAEVITMGNCREFFGFNRAKHAVLEAAILATRLEFLPKEEILREFERLSVIVEKTAGEQERRAMDYLDRYVRVASPGR